MSHRIVSWYSVVALVTCNVLATGCNSSQSGSSVAAAPLVASPSPALAPAGVPPTAPAVTQASWTPSALEELLAPIALYPDQLLGQILAASVNAQEVLDAGNWLLQNQGLKSDDLDSAAQKAGFGPAMRALVQFPTVVDMLCQQIDWTRQIGAAFVSDQKAVLDAVQRLRAQAAKVGNLKSTPQQHVETHAEGDKIYVEVKPANPQIVYVPQYDPQVVYVTPPPTTTVVNSTSSQDTVSTDTAIASGLLGFGVGVFLGAAIANNNYCYPHWGAGAVYYGPRPFYPPAYAYRPAYGAGFHPAYRYAPPAGYRNRYNNVRVNPNINVNNNYFNRFSHDQNLRVDSSRNSVNALNGRETQGWKGQSAYTGARGSGSGSGSKLTNAPVRSPAATRTDRVQQVDRGYGGSSLGKPSSRDMPAAREFTNTPRNDLASQSTDMPSRNVTDVSSRTATPTRDLSTPQAGAGRPQGAAAGAFDGIGQGDSGRFDRAASARGRASAGSRSLRGGRG